MFNVRTNEIKRSAMALIAAGMLAAAAACGGGEEPAAAGDAAAETQGASGAMAAATAEATAEPTSDMDEDMDVEEIAATVTPYAAKLATAAPDATESQGGAMETTATAVAADSAPAEAQSGTATRVAVDATATPAVMDVSMTHVAVDATATPAVGEMTATATAAASVDAQDNNGNEAESDASGKETDEAEAEGDQAPMGRECVSEDYAEANAATRDQSEITFCFDGERGDRPYTMPFSGGDLEGARPGCNNADQRACELGDEIVAGQYSGECSLPNMPIAVWSTDFGFWPISDQAIANLMREHAKNGEKAANRFLEDSEKRDAARNAGVWGVISHYTDENAVELDFDQIIWLATMQGALSTDPNVPVGYLPYEQRYCWVMDSDSGDLFADPGAGLNWPPPPLAEE